MIDPEFNFWHGVVWGWISAAGAAVLIAVIARVVA